MKIKFILIGIFLLVLVSGCTEYKCKEGTKQGDTCYTNIETVEWYGCDTIREWDILYIEQFIFEIADYYHLTPNHNCVIQEIELLNITNFWINDTSIKAYWDDFRKWHFELRNDGKEKDVCINVTYTYRWQRYIWDECDKYCVDEINEYGGEIRKKLWCD